MNSKKCVRCKESKPCSAFYAEKRCKDGFMGACKTCMSDASKRLRSKNSVRENVSTPDRKKCSRCKLVKPREMFVLDKNRGDGVRYVCRQCESEIARDRRVVNGMQSAVLLNKICVKCGLSKPSNEFNSDRGTRGGLRPQCKSCFRPAQAATRLRRRIRIRGTSGCISNNKIREIYSAGLCFYCNVRFDDFNKPTIDHYIPLALGGLHNDSNVVPACSYCNDSKGSKHPDDFLAGMVQIHI